MLNVSRLHYLIVAILLLCVSFWSVSGRAPGAAAQDIKRYVYKVVDVPPDNAAMQSTLNEYGAAGWELVGIGMGDMTAPRLIFKK